MRNKLEKLLISAMKTNTTAKIYEVSHVPVYRPESASKE